MSRLNIDDQVAVRDGTGIWKPATVTKVEDDRFVAAFTRNAGPETITVLYDGTIPWRLADAALLA